MLLKHEWSWLIWFLCNFPSCFMCRWGTCLAPVLRSSSLGYLETHNACWQESDGDAHGHITMLMLISLMGSLVCDWKSPKPWSKIALMFICPLHYLPVTITCFSDCCKLFLQSLCSWFTFLTIPFQHVPLLRNFLEGKMGELLSQRSLVACIKGEASVRCKHQAPFLGQNNSKLLFLSCT